VSKVVEEVPRDIEEQKKPEVSWKGWWWFMVKKNEIHFIACRTLHL
jgi:hypothetical protein